MGKETLGIKLVKQVKKKSGMSFVNHVFTKIA